MMKPNSDEYLLARSACDGDSQALAELVERLRAPFFGLAYAELRHFEDAQDAVANALLRVCQSIETLREPDRFRQWANSIVRNEVRRLVQQRSHVLLIEEADGTESGMAEVEALAMRLDIQAALRRLPTVHRHALTLFYLDGHPIIQIADQTGQPTGTVKSWLHHGRKNLAHILQEYAPMMTSNIPTQTSEIPTDTVLKRAVLIHSDLTPEMIQRVAESLNGRGYALHVPSTEEYDRLCRAMDAVDYSLVDEWVKQFDLIVLDETVDGHSALEHVINLNFDPEWGYIPIYVLMADTPPSYTASAYFNAGVSGLIFKDQAKPNTPTLEFSDQRTVILWQRFTERARRVVLRAEDEAKRFGENSVTTEHLLLGIMAVPDCLGARLLSEQNGVDFQELRQAITLQIPQGSGHDPNRAMGLTPHLIKTIGYAQEEAQAMGHSWVGAEHFLLGMLRQNESATAQILTTSNITLEKTRGQIGDFLKR